MRNDKRNIYFRFLRDYQATKAEKTIFVKDIFGNKLEGTTKAGDDYLAKGLTTKVLFDFKAIYGKKYETLRVREVGKLGKLKEVEKIVINFVDKKVV